MTCWASSLTGISEAVITKTTVRKFCLIFIFGASSVLTGSIVAVPAIAFTIFINCLELLVGAIQAYVFTLLSAIYFGMAVAEDH